MLVADDACSWIGTFVENGWRIEIRPKLDDLGAAIDWSEYDRVVWDPVAGQYDGDKALELLKARIPDHEITITKKEKP